MSRLSPKRGLKQMQVEGAKTFGIFLHSSTAFKTIHIRPRDTWKQLH